MLFSTLERRAKSLHCGDLARLASVEKSIVGKKSYDFFRRMLFSDSVENFRHCRKKHMTVKKSYDFFTVIWLFDTVGRKSSQFSAKFTREIISGREVFWKKNWDDFLPTLSKSHMIVKKSYDFFPDYAFFRQCRKFSTLSEKSIVGKSHMTFFFDYAFFNTSKTRQVATLLRLASVEKSIVGKKSYDFFRRMLFSDSVENFRYCRKKS